MKKYNVTVSNGNISKKFKVLSTGTFGAILAGSKAYPGFNLISVRPELKHA